MVGSIPMKMLIILIIAEQLAVNILNLNDRYCLLLFLVIKDACISIFLLHALYWVLQGLLKIAFALNELVF